MAKKVTKKSRKNKRVSLRKKLFSSGESLFFVFAIVLAIVALLLILIWPKKDRAVVVQTPVFTPTPAPTATPTPEPTASPTPSPSPSPTPSPTPVLIDGIEESLYYQTAAPGADYSDPAQNKLINPVIYADGSKVSTYSRFNGIHMVPSSQYTELEGITTFRGSNYRDRSSYGTIPENPTSFDVVWEKKIGSLDGWSGVGWTGQASAVRWPAELREKMNIVEEKRTKDDLIEVIYATLDGKIYFIDLEDGQPTRDPIKLGAPIKGSLTLDPRGYPLLYCGQGIYDVDGKRMKCGTRIWSLYDQSLLYFINGSDEFANRAWRAFDCSPLIDAATDTMITAGENGVLYSVQLNTKLTDDSVSVEPVIDRYVYTQSIDGKIGTENSIAIYNNYVYFATNVGIIQCVDLNTLELVWSFNAQDDIDASLTIEVEPDGLVALYGANELDIRGGRGTSQMFKLNALTGELLWNTDSGKIRQNDENGGGSFATPAIGKGSLSGLVYFHVARTVDTNGMVYALDKATGEVVWSYATKRYGWSSPTLVYSPSGKGYVVVGSSNGMLRLFDGLTGEVLASADIGSNIEGSPIVFNDTLVVGTRGSKIYGVKIG